MRGPFDLTAIHAVHDELRLGAKQLAELTVRADLDPRAILRVADGWVRLKALLRAHQAAEDEALWPVLRRGLAGRPAELALLEVMEAEHGAIDQVIDVIDATLADPGAGSERLGDLSDAFVTGLLGHLRHEEDRALPLVQTVLTRRQWLYFIKIHTRKVIST